MSSSPMVPWCSASETYGMPWATKVTRLSRRCHAAATFSHSSHPTGADRHAPTRSGQSIQYCRTKDGVKLAMASTGRGLPLVRPPTWFNHLEYDWHVQFRSALYRFLADRYQLIRYDGRGNGLSDRYVPEISLATIEHDLEAVVDALHLQRYALLGISQGAPIAIAHAVRHPERVSKLVLNGGFALGGNKRGSAKDQETAQAHLTLMRHGWGDEHSAYLRTFSMLYFQARRPRSSGHQQSCNAWPCRGHRSPASHGQRRHRYRRSVADGVDPHAGLAQQARQRRSLRGGATPCLGHTQCQIRGAGMENHVPMPDEPAWPIFIGEIEAFLRE